MKKTVLASLVVVIATRFRGSLRGVYFVYDAKPQPKHNGRRWQHNGAWCVAW